MPGRIEYVDLTPLCATEIDGDDALQRLWVRRRLSGQLPGGERCRQSYTRQSCIRTYLERDVPMFGPRIPAATLERFWIMLAHNQGTLLNASRLANSLAVSAPTVTNYLGLLVDLLLVRRLLPCHTNAKKRLVKSPKTYIRDSGLVHALLGIETHDDLLGHPVVGASWEGFAIGNLLAVTPHRARASFYRTARGAEIDLLLKLGARHGIWAIEIKRGLAPKAEKGFHIALDDIRPDRAFLVYSGANRYPKGNGIEAIGLRALAEELRNLSY